MNGKGSCTSMSCSDVDGGFAVPSSVNHCVEFDAGSSSSSSSSGSSSGKTSSSGATSSSGGAPVPENVDEGCAASPSSTTTLPLIAVPLGIGILFALRRRKK